jgi:hypothetical protein
MQSDIFFTTTGLMHVAFLFAANHAPSKYKEFFQLASRSLGSASRVSLSLDSKRARTLGAGRLSARRAALTTGRSPKFPWGADDVREGNPGGAIAADKVEPLGI